MFCHGAEDAWLALATQLATFAKAGGLRASDLFDYDEESLLAVRLQARTMIDKAEQADQ